MNVRARVHTLASEGICPQAYFPILNFLRDPLVSQVKRVVGKCRTLRGSDTVDANRKRHVNSITTHVCAAVMAHQHDSCRTRADGAVSVRPSVYGLASFAHACMQRCTLQAVKPAPHARGLCGDDNLVQYANYTQYARFADAARLSWYARYSQYARYGRCEMFWFPPINTYTYPAINKIYAAYTCMVVDSIAPGLLKLRSRNRYVCGFHLGVPMENCCDHSL